MQAKDVMTIQVHTVHRNTPVPDVARLLLDRRISAVPVVDSAGRVEGIISEGDLMRRQDTGTEARASWWLRLFQSTETAAAHYVKSHGLTAEDVMTRKVIAVDQDVPLAEIAMLLEENGIKRVPVVHDGRLVGIVSRANLLRALASQTAPPRAAGRVDDQALRNRLLNEIEHQAWATAGNLNVIVEDGVVHLWGLVDSEEERKAMLVAARNLPGVRAVEDHLVSRGSLHYTA